MSSSLALPVPLSSSSIDSYIQNAQRIPMLSAEEERSLALRLRDHGDLEAARGLILPHLRYVVRIARGYTGYGLPLPDLIQEGNIGLMKAVKRFDPDVGVRLVSFAVHWIKAEIHEFVIRNWRIVKVATTKAQRKLFFNLRNTKKRLGWLSKDEVEAVAADLNVKPETVLEMEARLNNRDIAYDLPNNADEETHQAPSTWLEDNSQEPAMLLEHQDSRQWQHDRLNSGLEGLDERSRDILQQRWLNDGDKATLQELADHYGVSAERIRQLEKAAMKKLRSAIEA